MGLIGYSVGVCILFKATIDLSSYWRYSSRQYCTRDVVLAKARSNSEFQVYK